jgi:hypothetical protein
LGDGDRRLEKMTVKRVGRSAWEAWGDAWEKMVR